MRISHNRCSKIAAILMVTVGLPAGWMGSVHADDGPVKLTSSAESTTVSKSISQSVERVQMLVKSSRILTLDERIPKFQVHNETILGATPVSQNQIQIFAKAPGTTQLNLWDVNDKLYTVDVTVTPDAREVEGILGNQLPLASLKVLPVNDSAIISGTVTSVDDVEKAVAITEQFYTTVVNNIRVVGVQQILLHTRIMEVSRTKLRELGIDWGTVSGRGYFYNAPGGLINGDITSLGLGGFVSSGAQATNKFILENGEFLGLIRALRRNDLVKLLAEPTVVATHGRPARFNVGGRVPTIIPGNNGSFQIKYEEFGTSIDFLPFVIGPGRVRLEVRPEVSEVDPTIGQFVNGVQVTGFRTRYVETAVEMQAGQTFAIAGLLSSRTESSVKSTPFFGDIPYIGSMFRRISESRNDIELLITVTPELVSAMDPHETPMGGPGLNSASPNDNELYLNGHLEVPNLMGTDGCRVGQGCEEGCANESCHEQHSGVVVSHGSALPPTHYEGGEVIGDPVYGSDFGVGTVLPSNSFPAGAIVPGNDPVSVGNGITISSPSN